METDFDNLITIGFVLVFVIAAYKTGVEWERDRPRREAEEARRQAELLVFLLDKADSEFRQHRRRINESDATTERLLNELFAAKEELATVAHSSADTSAWPTERLHQAVDAVQKDRSRYIVKLSAEEEERMRKWGIDHPALRHPELAGYLKTDALPSALR